MFNNDATFYQWARNVQMYAVMPKCMVQAFCSAEANPQYSHGQHSKHKGGSTEVVQYDIVLNSMCSETTQRDIAARGESAKRVKTQEPEITVMKVELVGRTIVPAPASSSSASSSTTAIVRGRMPVQERWHMLHEVYAQPNGMFEAAEELTKQHAMQRHGCTR